ncbi:inactive tyrosine-protein kinase transmembrane receptor ROR1 isoform X2 [Ixodes scapularis]|uniref:inactive tyrosine-protein kinase transmembrane receptor ROR1 isoform X2 n=1 Tax=Ixodes scapularis TaxID=6945 RepID=UPI001C38CA3B|nr:inactive tyrosine-protein kinase transmembrane receptor ROR1 isoform X2 [Ixodes scapularis]
MQPVPFESSDVDQETNEVATSTSATSHRDSGGPSGEPEKPQRKKEKDSFSKLHVRRPLTNMTRDSGDSVRLKCEVAGGAVGAKIVFSWFKNDAPVQEERNRLEIRQYPRSPGSGSPGSTSASAAGYGSRLRIVSADVHDTGYYRCEASDGRNVVETTGILRVSAGPIHHAPAQIPQFPPVFPHFPGLGGSQASTGGNELPIVGPPPPLPPISGGGGGSCQIYQGITCGQYLGNRSVFVRPPPATMAAMEEKLAAAFTVIATSQDVSPQCHKYAIPSLCFFAFPPCEPGAPGGRAPEPRSVCRDECELLEHSLCRMEYSIAKRHPLIGQQKILPVCEELAPVGSPESESCLRLGVPHREAEDVNKEETCYVHGGEDYRGTVAETISGLPCQLWTHQILFSRIAEYPEIVGGHNYCRNPGGMDVQPWCFTSGPVVKKEVCNIPKCVDYLWLYILLPSIATMALVGLLLAIACFRRRGKPSPNLPPTKGPKGVALRGPPQQNNMELNRLLPRATRAPEVPSPRVRFLQELGEGAFGKVYRGELLPVKRDCSLPIQVAIKTLKENAAMKTQQDFQREAELMSDLQHPNIVCLLGVCTKEEPLCMLFEYMPHGDLHEFLVQHSPRCEGTTQVLDLADFLHISRQVAAGMEYLSAHHYVHRDLAARNCLVGESLTVKISDFGLSRDVYSSDYYRVQSKSLLPVRWMPPESILYGRFTTDSDVWSFGVVLWEVFSYGLQPYYGYANQEVIDLVRGRQLLPCPEDCPPHLYALMVECWHEVPNRRPHFRELHARLCSWQALHARSASLSTHGSNHTGSTSVSHKGGSPLLGAGVGAAPERPVTPLGGRPPLLQHFGGAYNAMDARVSKV